MIFLCDFETTGLVKDGVTDFLVQPGITQIGVVVLADAEGDGGSGRGGFDPYAEVANFKTLVNPEISEQRWEAGAIKITGIGPEQVKDAPTFFAVFDKFAELAQSCDTWSGYNTKFDKDILWHQLLRYGFERSFPWPRLDLDVMKLASEHMAMQGKRGTKRPKLIEIYEHLFNESFDAHDALEDIRATARVLRELRK